MIVIIVQYYDCTYFQYKYIIVIFSVRRPFIF